LYGITAPLIDINGKAAFCEEGWMNVRVHQVEW
jgi:hypothetical protein